MFAVTRLIRSRELRLLEAVGVSRRRALAAIVIPTLLLGLLGLGVRQWALPGLAQEARESPYGAFEFRKGKRITVRDDHGNVWFVRKYDLNTAKLEGARILKADGTMVLVADELVWDTTRDVWYITNTAQTHDIEALTNPDSLESGPREVTGELPFGGLYPSDFSRRRRSYSDRPITELMDDAAERPDHTDLHVTLWHELWHPFQGLVLLLFGMGVVLTATTRKLYFSGAIVLGAVVGHQIATFWFETIAAAGAFPVWMGASITPIFFGFLGSYFYWRA
jgi:lipopolysaccharide export LptBFGC system permease protein LptF